MQISEKRVFLKAADHLACEVGEDLAILHFPSNTYFGLNSVGSFVWKMLDNPVTVAEMCAAVADEFDVRHEQCLPDVIKLVHDLLDHGLVTEVVR